MLEPEGNSESAGALIERVRVAQGKSQDVLAEALRDVSGNLSVNREYVSRWEAGRRVPTPYWRRHLSTVLNIPQDDLDRAATVARTQRAGDTRPSRATAYAFNALGMAGWPSRVDAARRSAIELLNYQNNADAMTLGTDASVDTVMLRWLVASPDVSAERTEGKRRVNAGDVSRVRAVRRNLKSLDDTYGGEVASPMARAYLRDEAGPLLEGQYSETTGRQLLEATAELMLDTGWMTYDSGAHPLARSYMFHALRLAHAAENRLLGGRILCALSHQALHLNEVRLAVDLARAARTGAAGVATPKASAMMAAMEACAQAADNSIRLCTDALVEAERSLSQAQPGDMEPEWLDFDEGGLWGHAARAYRDLTTAGRSRSSSGSEGAAARYAEQSLALCHDDHSRTRAQRNAILASTHLRLGDLDHAAAIGERIVADAWNLSSNHVRIEVASLATAIGATGAPPASAGGFLARAQELLSATQS